MLQNQIKEAIARAYGVAACVEVNRIVWGLHAAAKLSDEEAQSYADQIEARKALAKAAGTARATNAGKPRPYPARRYTPTPDRERSRSRRRHLAMSGPMPPAIAASFTQAESAVLKVVADEVRKWKTCDLSLGEIAARAGCQRTSAQNALRKARELGLITIDVRKQGYGQPNLTNVVRIVSPEWLTWINKGPKAKVVQNFEPNRYSDSIDRRVAAKVKPSGLAMRRRNSPTRL